MFITTLPALSDQLNDYQINAGQLFQALEDYANAMNEFIRLNHDAMERPLEYIEIKDHQNTVLAFKKLLPLIVPEDELDLLNLDDEDDE